MWLDLKTIVLVRNRTDYWSHSKVEYTGEQQLQSGGAGQPLERHMAGYDQRHEDGAQSFV